MNVMVIIDILVVGFGLYMIFSGLKMKKTGKISSAVITEEEIKKCRRKKEFIDFIYWKEAAFGCVMCLSGIVGLINELVVSIGKVAFLEMFVFLGAFLWFQQALRSAREQFL